MTADKSAAAWHPGDGPVRWGSLIEAAQRDVSDADRCDALGIMPATHQLHRRLREVTTALAAETARADQARTALALSDKQHHECIDKLHALRKRIADAPHDYCLVGMGEPCTCWKSAAPTTGQ